MKIYFSKGPEEFIVELQRDQCFVAVCSAQGLSFGRVLSVGDNLAHEVNRLLELKAAADFDGVRWTGVKLVGNATMLRFISGIMLEAGERVLAKVERAEGCTLQFAPGQGALRASVPRAPVVDRLERKVRVMVIDDSPTVVKLLTRILSASDKLEVVATCGLPSEAEGLIEKHRPDVLTLDLHMPQMNGLELYKILRPKYNIPTIVVSSITPEEGPLVLETLEEGAFDYIQKPDMSELQGSAGEHFVQKILAAHAGRGKAQGRARIQSRDRFATLDTLVLIGSSTGGTNALRSLLTALPNEIPPIVITQHIPPVFSRALAERLDKLCPFKVKEAEDGDVVEANTVYIAPGDRHISFEGRERLQIKLRDDAPVNHFRPSVDFMFASALRLLPKRRMVSVILTGMGSDGARAMKELHDRGCLTIAQDEKSSVVWGMPKEAIDRGGVDKVVALDDMAEQLIAMVNQTLARSA